MYFKAIFPYNGNIIYFDPIIAHGFFFLMGVDVQCTPVSLMLDGINVRLVVIMLSDLM